MRAEPGQQTRPFCTRFGRLAATGLVSRDRCLSRATLDMTERNASLGQIIGRELKRNLVASENLLLPYILFALRFVLNIQKAPAKSEELN